MKTLILSIATLLLCDSASAAQVLKCTLSLMAPIPFAPSHLWIAPETGVYEFKYNSATEKTLKLAVKAVVPDHTQFGLVTAQGTADTALTIEFSKTDPDGNQYYGDDFGFYFRRPTDGQHSYWSMGGYSRAASTEIAISKDETGYVIMNCK